MKWTLAAPVLLALVACGTPQEQCIAQATRDMAVLNRLIGETGANISRGYAYADTVVYLPEWVDCTPRATDADPTPKTRMCFDDVPTTVRKPVAIDLAAEAAKLASMQKRRAEMARAQQPAIAACQARYPG